MNALFFDAGPIISLVMSRLGWILPELKKYFGGSFYITPAVQMELVERPLTINRFKFEALEVLKMINDGVLEVYNDVPLKEVARLKRIANSAARIQGKTMDLVQEGELQSVACAQMFAAPIVMDERTLRLFIEDNAKLKALLQQRFHAKVAFDARMIKSFSSALKGIRIIRSIELVSVAYTKGLLDSYIPRRPRGKELLLDSVLWAVRYNGCAVTDHEIEEIKGLLLR